MDSIKCSLVHISWKEPICKKKTLFNIKVIKYLRNAFKLGPDVHVILHNRMRLCFSVDRVETHDSIYTFSEQFKIIKTHKVTNNVIEIEEDVTFRTELLTKLSTKYGWSKLFGFDDIDIQVYEFLNSSGNETICLYGPSGCGKNLFLNMLELRESNISFIVLDCLNWGKASEIDNIIRNINESRTKIVLYIKEADRFSEFETNLEHLCMHLGNMMGSEDVDIKVIITTSDRKLLHKRFCDIINSYIQVLPLNTNNKFEFLKYLLTKLTKKERQEEELYAFAKTLRGYTAANIYRFVKRVFFKFPDLPLEQLKDGLKNKEYIPQQLKSLMADLESLRWSDIGGYKEVKEKIYIGIQKPILNGKRIARGIILHGPPGCSKTMFARALATECDLSLFAVMPSNILSCNVGESEARLRNIMVHAMASAPSIIFFDEIDILLPGRHARSDNSVTGSLLTELMTFMDGVETKSDHAVIVMAATNRLEDIDEALLRPGRMDLKIKIDLPDQDSREAILNIIFADNEVLYDEEVLTNISAIAVRLEGKSGAEIVDIGLRIKRLPYYDDECLVTMKHVNTILDTDCK